MSAKWTLLAIAISAWILGVAWAVSSPEGSSPDDNFHLASVWCATDNPEACRVADDSMPDILAQVPEQLLNQECYAFRSDASGACADIPDDRFTTTNWFNAGLYPPVFYEAMSIFVGPDIWRSIVVMRIAALTVALAACGLALWAAPQLRSSQVVAWSVAWIPLAMFLIPSTNPSSWGIAGVAAMWPAAFALATATSMPRSLLAISAVLVAGLLACSRGDTAAMATVILVTVLILYFRERRQLAAVLVGLLVAAAMALVFLGSSQTDSLQEGLPSELTGSGWTLLWRNVLNLPSLWTGAFGVTFSLGWFDTPIPPLSWFASFATASGMVLLGLARIGIRKGVLLCVVAAMAIALPLIMLQRSGAAVGDLVQPRYLLPIVFAFIGIALAPLDGKPLTVTIHQRWVLTGLTILATSVALHAQLRRYVTGTDVSSPDLNTGQEWPVGSWLSPMEIWTLGTIAGAVMFYCVFSLITEKSAVTRAGQLGMDPGDAPHVEPQTRTAQDVLAD